MSDDFDFYGRGDKPSWFGEADDERVVMLDASHAYMLTRHSGSDEFTGALVWHRRQDGSWCGGGVRWGGPDGGPKWTLHSLEPLHIEPSVKCGTCERLFGDNGMSHGFIRDGGWVPAGELPGWARG
jgi:hypothetical protein